MDDSSGNNYATGSPALVLGIDGSLLTKINIGGRKKVFKN